LATSITLTAAANVLNNYQQDFISKKDYLDLVKVYANSHRLKREDGKTVPWIDENLNPYTGDWISRTRLKNWTNAGWSQEKGGAERGKDYNHSTFCDLIITGVAGLRPQEDNTLIVNPLLPDEAWDYFALDNIFYHGKKLAIIYDKNGKKYNWDSGLSVYVNGKKAGSSPTLGKIVVSLD
jgi:hypothetical protein